MEIRRGKAIDSARLKRDLDKGKSVAAAGSFSRAIPPGPEIRKCPICGCEDAVEIVKVYNFLYRECRQCGVAYVANPPNEGDLRSAYSSDYYTAANKILLANDGIIDYRVKQIGEPKVAFVASHLTTKKKTWLDVGCGVGEILCAAKAQGFSVLGFETNEMEGEYARHRFGIDVRNEYVSEKTLDQYPGQFGVISLFSVIEHVLSPNALLKDVAQIQQAGDNLVLEVPHYPSISVYSQITFPEQVNRMMHPPLHLYLFPFRALSAMLKTHGYSISAAWYFGQDFYEMFSTMGLFAPSLSESALHRALAPLMNDLQRVVDDHELSDEVLIVAEKVI